jgi:Dyp-type peroxidase family
MVARDDCTGAARCDHARDAVAPTGVPIRERGPGWTYRPDGLRELPSFPRDVLDPAWCGGDLAVQICASRAADAQAALDRLLDRIRRRGPRAMIFASRTGPSPQDAKRRAR